ncbi:hypothetical protein ERO13_D02G035550v2, partial [Gossypium hirsutum]
CYKIPFFSIIILLPVFHSFEDFIYCQNLAFKMGSTQAKMVLLFIAMMVLISFAAAIVTPHDFILKPSNLGRKILEYYDPGSTYGPPSGGGGNPCC